MKILACFAAFLFSLSGNAQKLLPHEKEKARQKIVETEAAFRDMFKAKGPDIAFWTFAAPDAVIKRENDTLIRGKNHIRDYYAKPSYKEARVDWKPDFTDVSDDGTMGYTYGKYIWTYKDKDGKEQTQTGVFHTVWKRMPDGSWKFVWD